MTCSVPGCRIPPEHREQVAASKHGDLHRLPMRREPDQGEVPVPAGMALVDLCPTHHGEFERLGWLVEREEDDGEA